MRTTICSDTLRRGHRRARLAVVTPTGEVVRFSPDGMPGVYAVLSSTYEKNGKWSGHTYTVGLAEGAALVDLTARPHEESLDRFSSRAEVRAWVEELAGRSVIAASFDAFAASEWPATQWDAGRWAALCAREKAAEALA